MKVRSQLVGDSFSLLCERGLHCTSSEPVARPPDRDDGFIAAGRLAAHFLQHFKELVVACLQFAEYFVSLLPGDTVLCAAVLPVAPGALKGLGSTRRVCKPSDFGVNGGSESLDVALHFLPQCRARAQRR